MALSRRLRKDAVMRLLEGGAALAQRCNRRQVNLILSVALRVVKACLPLRIRLARNMKAAELYRRGLVDLHFDRAADQMRMLMHVLRAGFQASGACDRFQFDESFRHLDAIRASGRGALIISPHLCGYPLFPRVLADRFPCSIYLRRSPDPRKHKINMMVGAAGDGHLVYPPPDSARSERLFVALRVLREGRGLYLTPDLPRKPHEGTPVHVLGQRTYFPAGVAIMAMRTRVPIVMVDWHWSDGAYRVRCHEPLDPATLRSRSEAAGSIMRLFAARMDEAVRSHPEMWWNWLDKRWTRLLRTGSAHADPTGPRAIPRGTRV
jgi:lauroyl/myristoyl acyltransferase